MPPSPNHPRYPEIPGDQTGEDYGNYQGGGTESGGGCAPGTFEHDIDASGNKKPGPDGECVTAAEAQRRNDLWVSKGNGVGSNGGNNGGQQPAAPTGGGFAKPGAYPKYNFGDLPQFKGLPDYVGPTFEEAMNDPGYRFAADEGRRAREASAASRGDLRTGGTLRSLEKYGQNMAAQQYANVDSRNFRNYGQRYRQELDRYSPTLADYMMRSQAEIGSKNLGFNQGWRNYWNDNLSVQDLLALLSGAGA
jgi:hypothetical protein